MKEIRITDMDTGEQVPLVEENWQLVEKAIRTLRQFPNDPYVCFPKWGPEEVSYQTKLTCAPLRVYMARRSNSRFP